MKIRGDGRARIRMDMQSENKHDNQQKIEITSMSAGNFSFLRTYLHVGKEKH